MEILLKELRERLAEAGTAENRLSGERFFKESVKLYGIKSAEVKRMAADLHAQLKKEDKTVVWSVCESLWKSGMLEESFIACHLSEKQVGRYVEDDFTIFEHWVSQYISNWASCDTFCNHTLGGFMMKFPEYLTKLKDWTASDNRWVKRAAAVSLIVPARKGLFFNDCIDIATLLLTDRDDMVQKGYGWLLKVSAEKHLEEVFQFVMQHKAIMPRTALRYAIEKMPPERKAMAMSK